MLHGRVATYNKGCRCDECKVAKSAAGRAYRQRHLERERERGRRNREKDPDYIKRWRAANPERVRATRRAWARANPEKIRAKVRREAKSERKKAYDAEWRKTPRGRVYQAGLQHARRQAPLTPEGRDFAVILRADPCSYCGGVAGTIDHITAIANGGDGEWTNLTAACRSCNGRKRTRSLLQHLAAAV